MSATAAPYGLKPVSLVGGRPFAGSTRLLQIASGYAPTGGLGFGDPVKLAAGCIQKDVGTTTLTPVGIFLGCTYTDPNSLQKTFKQSYPTAGIVATDIFAYVMDDPYVVFQAQADATLAYSAIGLNMAVNTTFTVTATEVSGNATLTVTASGNSYTVLTQGIFPGMALSGTGIAAGSLVNSVTATTIVMSKNATASASNTVTIQGYTTLGNSVLSLGGTAATTNTLPIRIIDFVTGPTSLAPTPSAAGDAFTDCLCVWNATMHRYNNSTGT